MNREEREAAIAYIKGYRKLDEDLHNTAPKDSISYYATDKCLKYWDMAIKALSQEPCEKCEVGNPCLYCEHEFSQKIEPCDECRNKRTSFCGNCKEYDEFEPCDDVISRDALISKLTELIKTERSTIEIKAKLIPMIEQLPSVTPKPIECDDATPKDIFCIGCDYKEQEHCTHWKNGKCNGNTEPCNDVVSRSDAIKALQKVACYSAAIRARMIGAIEELPPVTQKCEKCAMNGSGSKYCDNCGHKSGKWIKGKCSICGEHAPFWSMASTYYESKYCPNCGSAMVELQERSDKE